MNVGFEKNITDIRFQEYTLVKGVFSYKKIQKIHSNKLTFFPNNE